MLNTAYYYHGLIRKSVSVFGTCFNELYIQRTETDGSLAKLMKVPLTYAMKDKVLARINQDPSPDAEPKQAAIQLPRMSFEIDSITSMADRSLPALGRIVAIDEDDPNKVKRIYTPMPIDIDFKLSIYSKNQEDGLKIIEQIVPFFRPDWTPTVHLIPEMGITLDMPIVRNPGLLYNDSFDGKLEDRRVMTWDMSFTMQSVLYGPIKSKPIIKFAQINSKIGEEADADQSPVISVVVEPGLTANGEATSNSAASIPNAEIFANSDFGFITTWTDNVG